MSTDLNEIIEGINTEIVLTGWRICREARGREVINLI